MCCSYKKAHCFIIFFKQKKTKQTYRQAATETAALKLKKDWPKTKLLALKNFVLKTSICKISEKKIFFFLCHNEATRQESGL